MAELNEMEVRISYGKALKNIVFWFALLLGITIGVVFSKVVDAIDDAAVKIEMLRKK